MSRDEYTILLPDEDYDDTEESTEMLDLRLNGSHIDDSNHDIFSKKEQETPNTLVPGWLAPFVTLIPFLTQRCPFDEVHWAWADFCSCGFGHEEESQDWHGGILDLKNGTELQPCGTCYPEHSSDEYKWALTQEEEALIVAWRTFRADYLDMYSDETPFKYEVSVSLGGQKTFLMSRTQGPVLPGPVALDIPSKNLPN